MSPYEGTGGAQGEDVPHIETLFRLLSSATVRIHAAPEGYAEGVSGATPWGSGFFVAPGWVLTCAHVALRGGRDEGGKREVGLSFEETGDGGATVTHTVRGLVEWAQPEHSPPGDIWPGPDLALVRVLNPPPHPCVWLSERTARFTLQDVYFFGWGQLAGSASPVGPVDGRCTVTGQYGTDGWLKLGNQDEIPHGVSGGPVVDLSRGEVIGVVKASRSAGRDGGLATSIVQLRRIAPPAGTVAAETEDTYQHVMHAHDRYHAQRHRDDETTRDTWTDIQGPLRATAQRALTAGRRAELLGLLAELPPPLSTARLDEIIAQLTGRRYDGILPAPRGWRDGLGMLYDPRPGLRELDAVLRYAVYAATADRPYPAPGAANAGCGTGSAPPPPAPNSTAGPAAGCARSGPSGCPPAAPGSTTLARPRPRRRRHRRAARPRRRRPAPVRPAGDHPTGLGTQPLRLAGVRHRAHRRTHPHRR
ncbi:S1 family peptidase [Streptomyces harbinensis]